MSILGNQKGSIACFESMALKIVSLLLAIILWVTILGLKREEIKKNVKLEPLLPPGVMITNKIPGYIQFTFSGPRMLLKDVEKKLQPIRPDLRRTQESTVGFSISEDLIGELPSGVRVTNISPPNILIRLEEVVERYVNVKPTIVGAVHPGEEVGTVKAIPAKVAVSGPKSLLVALDSVGTEEFNVDDLQGSKEGVVAVEVDTTQGFQLSRDKVVRVRVTTKRARK